MGENWSVWRITPSSSLPTPPSGSRKPTSPSGISSANWSSPISQIAEAPVLSLPRLLKQVDRLRKRKKRVAFTNGCFDLLHAGHLDTLERIKAKADCLIVAVNSDASVRRLKGSSRPLVPARERARLVAALKPVDYVILFAESTPLNLIRAVRPDLLGKGGDWQKAEIVGADVVRRYGGKVLVIPFLKGHSTTRLIEKICNARGSCHGADA